MNKKYKLLLLCFTLFATTPVLADTVNCGAFAEITRPVAIAIMIISPIILLVMGGVDFMGAVAASDEKAMKKATSTFIKRLIICIIILILPVIVNFVISWTTFGDLTSCW